MSHRRELETNAKRLRPPFIQEYGAETKFNFVVSPAHNMFGEIFDDVIDFISDNIKHPVFNFGHYNFYFTNYDDAVMFKLKFGQLEFLDSANEY